MAQKNFTATALHMRSVDSKNVIQHQNNIKAKTITAYQRLAIQAQTGMYITNNAAISCTKIPDYMTAEEIRETTLEDVHLSTLAELVLCGWSSINTTVQKELQTYWSFREETTVIHGILIKGRRIIVPTFLKDSAIKQLHINHVGIQKRRMLT